MQALEIFNFLDEEGRDLVERDLHAIDAIKGGGKKDAARLRTAIRSWERNGFAANQPIDFRRILDKRFGDGRMWEARFEKTSRSDGVHGYRFFYIRIRETQVVLVKVWGKAGSHTPDEVLREAWWRCQVALAQDRGGEGP